MKILRSGLAILVLSGAYLYALPSPTIFYYAIVFLHAAVGLILSFALLIWLWRNLRIAAALERFGWLLVAAGAAAGIALVFTGGVRALNPLLYTHIELSLAGLILLISHWLRGNHYPGLRPSSQILTIAGLVLAFASLAGTAWWTRVVRWERAYVIRNPTMPPATMNGEGDGPAGPFFPSSAQILHGGKIPAKFFMQSDACKRCHADIYNQWSSSVHHFSSFNNQWYRKSIEYMQDVAGVQQSKWCAGCHDPALLFSGRFDTPIKDRVQSPEAQAGMGCMMCHTIVNVKSTMGQGDYVLEYPEMHELASSENSMVRGLHDFLVYLNPEPHRRAFLKPFMRNQTPEFCSTCHKVHLDFPVNHYRWTRGFNEYDNWQASAVSGQGARSFYYPPKPQQCADCHMPLVNSTDAGNINGGVHSHNFAAANTAVPYANQDAKQLEMSEAFLKDKIVSVDIFALSTAASQKSGGELPHQELSTTFAVGEEAETSGHVGTTETAIPVTAPLNRADAAVRRGDSVRVDVVVRTRKVGHFFPAGTVDAYDVWLELQAIDEKGQVIYWSGEVEDGGRGAVEKGAHFYRSLLVDARGNPIDKRNAFAARSVVYVHLIPPGAADTAHFRLRIPENAGDCITLTAKLNYRKFSWFNTQFSFAGRRDPSEKSPDFTSDYDNGHWIFNAPTNDISAKLKEIPTLPIVTLAQDTVKVKVVARGTTLPEPKATLAKEDWERWNDYGIGLFLQGDLKGAEAAFQNVINIDPTNPDGWVNIGRADLQEGNLAGAHEVLEKALALAPDLARANFFFGSVLKDEGRFDEALGYFRKTLAQYPKDRVVRNNVGRILFLQRHYAEAVKEFEQVLAIDPEDLQAHYNLMLCYTGLGQSALAKQHETRYLRFKADEAAQSITGNYRMLHPEDNNERQSIHEHVSVPLGPLANPKIISRTGAPQKSSGPALP
jgi:tetratricopeptide (TPR) repeat protein